jgi:hypothetical protein
MKENIEPSPNTDTSTILNQSIFLYSFHYFYISESTVLALDYKIASVLLHHPTRCIIAFILTTTGGAGGG